MRHYSRWQTAAIVGVTLLVSLAAVPNVLSVNARAALPAWAQRTFELGNDLQGGAYVLLEVDRDDLRKQMLEGARDTLRNVLRQQRVQFSGLVIRNDGVEAWIREPDDMPRATTALEQLVSPLPAPVPATDRHTLLRRHVDGTPSLWAGRDASPPPPEYKLDIADRMVRLTVNEAAFAQRLRQARDQYYTLLTRRMVDLGGATLATVSPSGADRIVFSAKHDPDFFERLRYLRY